MAIEFKPCYGFDEVMNITGYTYNGLRGEIYKAKTITGNRKKGISLEDVIVLLEKRIGSNKTDSLLLEDLKKSHLFLNTGLYLVDIGLTVNVGSITRHVYQRNYISYFVLEGNEFIGRVGGIFDLKLNKHYLTKQNISSLLNIPLSILIRILNPNKLKKYGVANKIKSVRKQNMYWLFSKKLIRYICKVIEKEKFERVITKDWGKTKETVDDKALEDFKNEFRQRKQIIIPYEEPPIIRTEEGKEVKIWNPELREILSRPIKKH